MLLNDKIIVLNDPFDSVKKQYYKVIKDNFIKYYNSMQEPLKTDNFNIYILDHIEIKRLTNLFTTNPVELANLKANKYLLLFLNINTNLTSQITKTYIYKFNNKFEEIILI